MKRLLIPISFLACLNAAAQITVLPAPKAIFETRDALWPLKLYREVITGDTIYTLNYRNAAYSELTDIKSISLPLDELKELANAIKICLNVSAGETVNCKNFVLSKSKSGLFTSITIMHDRYDYFWGSPRDIQKLAYVILKL